MGFCDENRLVLPSHVFEILGYLGVVFRFVLMALNVLCVRSVLNNYE